MRVQAGKKVITGPANISPNGISCKSDTYIPPFREVQINIAVPRDGGSGSPKVPIRCSGVVVKSEKEPGGNRYDVYLYFTDLDAGLRRQLEKCLEAPPAPAGGN